MVKGDRGRIVMDEIRRELGAFEVESLTELDALQASQITSASRSRLGLLVATALVIGLLFLVSRLAIGQASIQLLLQQKAATEATRMQQVIAARTRELAELSTHIQTVTEREKAELARNLHDELGGLLTAANMDLAWLKGAAAGRDPTGAEKLHQLGLGLTEAMDVKRRVVESLRPALLDHFGLSTAFQNHFEETCQKAGLGFTAVMPGTLPGLPEELSIALFRVGQEALTNVIRHAKAKNVQLTLSADGGNVALSIEDDGIGIDTKSGNSEASHGIIGMRHRVETLGGTFTLQSTPGNGTRLKIQVPRQRPARFAPEVGF